MIQDKIETYGFMFLESDSPPLVQLVGMGLETRTHAYQFDNRERRQQSYLFQYTLAGRGQLFLEGQSHLVEPGQGFFLKLPSDTAYGLIADGEAWQFLWLMVSGPVADQLYEKIRQDFGHLLTLSASSPAVSSWQHLYQLARSRQIDRMLFSQELAFSFLCRLMDSLQQPVQPLSPLIQQAKALIAGEYAALLGIGDLADRLGVSQEHLSRRFRQETGTQLIDALTRTRLQHVIVLLREGKSLDEAAARCGFSSGNYLGKVFKRYVGLSPRAFMRDPVYRQADNLMIFPNI